jgi:hypothetical protein
VNVKFLYKGAPQIISLRSKDAAGKPTEREVILRPGQHVELDEDSPYVKSLIARGLLEKRLVVAEATVAAPKAVAGGEVPEASSGEAATAAPNTAPTRNKNGRQ